MVEVTLEEFEKNFDAYMDRIENNKEEFLVRKQDGTAVVAMPAEQLDQTVSELSDDCLLYTSPSPRDLSTSRMPSSA